MGDRHDQDVPPAPLLVRDQRGREVVTFEDGVWPSPGQVGTERARVGLGQLQRHGRTIAARRVTGREPARPPWHAGAVETGERMLIRCDGGPSMSRLVRYPPPLEIEEETGAPLEAWVEGRALARLVEGGFLFLDDKRIVATPAGRQRLDSVLAALLA